ncbi:cyclin Ctk2 [Schizosaccharomyces japonicus yFS275]|uniref:Cyclin Ctk2 n=1 Tax=Schizosaccharomyces japonicus (strain yFS275 / FY16936) TaxID=402676 RepID=B6JZL4_SCHJY|nr:cyclin Ctk2 [Schizosaccharomyces japonicus yFS275]EEB06982.1 cyclin Ctk2 [Schizosaccharomyces japonicus yFS275]
MNATQKHEATQMVESVRFSQPYFSEQMIQECLAGRDPKEMQLKIQQFAWITDMSRALRFPTKTIALAMMLCNRFHLYHKIVDIPYLDCATACVFVACKVEDTSKKIRDILIVYQKLRYPNSVDVDPQSPIMEEPKKRILSFERHLLELACFDFRTCSPHAYVVAIAKYLNVEENIARLAWDVCTDACRTFVLLKYPAHIVAYSCLSLACKLQGRSLPPISKSFCITQNEIYGALSDILDLFMHYNAFTIVGPRCSNETMMSLCIDLQRARGKGKTETGITEPTAASTSATTNAFPSNPASIAAMLSPKTVSSQAPDQRSSLAEQYRQSERQIHKAQHSCIRFLLESDRQRMAEELHKRKCMKPAS